MPTSIELICPYNVPSDYIFFLVENSILYFQESKYGAHIFHTEYKRVWDYLQSFSNWSNYEHKVKGYVRVMLFEWLDL